MTMHTTHNPNPNLQPVVIVESHNTPRAAIAVEYLKTESV